MSNKIISLGGAANNALMITPEMALKDALSMIGNEGALMKGKKLLVIALDDTNDNYDVSFTQAGMRSSECMALCEVAKMRFLSHMGYVVGEGDL